MKKVLTLSPEIHTFHHKQSTGTPKYFSYTWSYPEPHFHYKNNFHPWSKNENNRHPHRGSAFGFSRDKKPWLLWPARFEAFLLQIMRKKGECG